MLGIIILLGINPAFATNEQANYNEISKDGIKLTIQTDKKQYYEDETIRIHVTIENTLDSDLSYKINRSSYLNIGGYDTQRLVLGDVATFAIEFKGEKKETFKELLLNVHNARILHESDLYKSDQSFIYAEIPTNEILEIVRYEFVEMIRPERSSFIPEANTATLASRELRSLDFKLSQIIFDAEVSLLPYQIKRGTHDVTYAFMDLTVSVPITLLDGNLPSPLKQIREGASPEKISCKSNLQLVFKSSNNLPACVKLSSVSKLIERGWALS